MRGGRRNVLCADSLLGGTARPTLEEAAAAGPMVISSASPLVLYPNSDLRRDGLASEPAR